MDLLQQLVNERYFEEKRGYAWLQQPVFKQISEDVEREMDLASEAMRRL